MVPKMRQIMVQVTTMNSVPFFLLVLATLATPGFGQLKWDNTEQTFTAKPLDKILVARFRFTNVGNTSVKITDVRPSCGCTTATLQKTEYGPGESGEIAASFRLDGRVGHQEKSIKVTTDWVPPQPTFLRMTVNIPEVITIQPELVIWRVGEQPNPKTIRVAIPGDAPAKIVSIQSDNPAVKLELREVRPGKELEVKVTPANTSGPENATLLIRTDYPPENPATHYAYVRVK